MPVSSEVSLACHTYCDKGHSFIMVISDDPWHTHLLSSVKLCSCYFLTTKVCRGWNRTPNLRPFGANALTDCGTTGARIEGMIINMESNERTNESLVRILILTVHFRGCLPLAKGLNLNLGQWRNWLERSPRMRKSTVWIPVATALSHWNSKFWP